MFFSVNIKLAVVTWLLILCGFISPQKNTSPQFVDKNCIELDPTLVDHHTFTHQNTNNRFGRGGNSNEICILVKSYPLDNWKYGFSSLSLHIRSLNGNKYTYYVGDCRSASKSLIKTFLGNLLSLWFFQRVSMENSIHHLNPYQSTTTDNRLKCVYLTFDHHSIDITMRQKVEYINIYYMIGLIGGYVLIGYAPLLARQQIFAYAFGVFLGFFFSSIVLLYLVYSFVNKNSLLSLLTSGTFVISSGMGLSLLVKYLSFSLQTYPYVAAVYACFTSFVSLAMVYYYEPLENRKIANLFQWLIQLTGVIVLYNSSNLPKLSLLLIVAILAHLYLYSLVSKTKNVVGRVVVMANSCRQWIHTYLLYLKSRPQVVRTYCSIVLPNQFHPLQQSTKFITMDAYNDQGVFYTKKALDNLRLNILNHPKNIQYAKIVSRPLRYIEFASGGDHLTDEERSDHASWLHDSLVCDDEESLSHIISRSMNNASDDSLH